MVAQLLLHILKLYSNKKSRRAQVFLCFLADLYMSFIRKKKNESYDGQSAVTLMSKYVRGSFPLQVCRSNCSRGS